MNRLSKNIQVKSILTMHEWLLNVPKKVSKKIDKERNEGMKLPVEVTSNQAPSTVYYWKFVSLHTWQHQQHYPVAFYKSEIHRERYVVI
jgi:hypothetical protein